MVHALMHGFRSALLPPDPDTDPNFVMAQQFATQHGFHIAYRRDINCPNALFNKYEGVFLVMLEIRTGAGSDVDRHYIAYLAATGHVLDNEPGGKVPIVKALDRCSNKWAIKVFKHLFPRATSVFMKSVSEVSHGC